MVLPVALTHIILHMAHVGHPGMVRMKCRLCKTYWWPGLDSQVVNCCEGCEMSSKSQLPDLIPKRSILKQWQCHYIGDNGKASVTAKWAMTLTWLICNPCFQLVNMS